MSSAPRSTPTPATTSPGSARSSRGPAELEHLDDASAAAWVRTLDDSVVTALVAQVGLADAGEIVRHAAPEQITALLDEALWRADAPGADEAFDPAAFATWLEVLAELGPEATASRMGELPEELVQVGVHALAMVFDREALVSAAQDDGGELVDKALEGALTVDVGPFLVVSRGLDGWDALVDAILAWAEEDADAAEALLERCAASTADDVGDAGLYEVLTAAETAVEDAVADREQRRARRGFVAPWMARSFLALARDQDLEAVLDDLGRDSVTRLYFRELGRPEPKRGPSSRPVEDALVPVGARVGATPFETALAVLGATDPFEAARRVEELAYLVNVLVAGCPRRGERFQPDDALRAAIATCSLGFELVLERAPTARDLAIRLPADVLFRIAWGVLERDVRAPAARRLRKAHPDSDRAQVLAGLAELCPVLGGPLASADGGDAFIDGLHRLEQAEAQLAG